MPDPNLFHLDWDRVAEVLAAIVVLAFLLERALSVIFEHRFFIRAADERGLKEFIAVGVALFVCWHWDFDAISMILLSDHTTFIGEVVTAAVIAGGSKGSVKIFRDLMNWRSKDYDKLHPGRKGGNDEAGANKDAGRRAKKKARGNER